MREAAAHLVGRHDFTSFRASQCQADSPLRTLDELRAEPAGEEVHIHAAARSFLHHQVRNIVGTLALVGTGKWTARDVAAALDARDRSAAGPTAPPEGLYLTEVTYPALGQPLRANQSGSAGNLDARLYEQEQSGIDHE
jgi:tRNA pseudouridine38-40 synthase